MAEMPNLTTILESVKKTGAYAIRVFYGEEVGCDDGDTPPEQRRIRIMGYPVGYIGECRMLYIGTLADAAVGVLAPAKVVANPPSEDTFKMPGLYVWGTERAMEHFMAK